MPAPSGAGRPTSRAGAAGAAISAMPTPARSHPIVSTLLIATLAA
jgi:hypothetical protein